MDAQLGTINYFDSVIKKMQDTCTTLADIRILFDAIIDIFPAMKDRMAENDPIVLHRDL